ASFRIQHLNVTAERIKETQKKTKDDEILQMLVKVIQKGWPEKKEQVPVEIREYWHYRDELSVNNDTGASCNVISCQTLQKVTGEKNARLKPSQVELKCFGGEILKPKGE
ncbi:hypothetical protein CBL_20677, partial [Carabus blaptoides fortunei]